ALRRKAAAVRAAEEERKRKREELDAEKSSLEEIRSALARDRVTFEEEMLNTRNQLHADREAFEQEMDQLRIAFAAEMEDKKAYHEMQMVEMQADLVKEKASHEEMVEAWTHKHGAEHGHLHRIKREMDDEAAKRASEAATFAASVTRCLTALEMALARKDEDTGSDLDEVGWRDALTSAMTRANELSWSKMPEVHEMHDLAERKLKIVNLNVEIAEQIKMRCQESDPVTETGLENTILKIRLENLDGIDAELINRSVALSKLRLGINMGNAMEIKRNYRAACGREAGGGKEPFLLKAAEILEQCAATEVLAEALEKREVNALSTALSAAEQVIRNIDPMLISKADKPMELTPGMDVMLVTQVLHATGMQFGFGVEGLVKGLKDVVKQGKAMMNCLLAMAKRKSVLSQETLSSEEWYPTLEMKAENLLELTWRNDEQLQSVYEDATAQLKSLEANLELNRETKQRLNIADASESTGLDVFLDKYNNTVGADREIIRQAQTASALKVGMVNNDLKQINEMIKMLDFARELEPPLVKAGAVQLLRLRAEKELNKALEDVTGGSKMQRRDINALHKAVQQGERAVGLGNDIIATGAKATLVHGNLPSILESAKFLIIQMRAVDDMLQAREDVKKLDSAIQAAEEVEETGKLREASTSIKEEIAENVVILKKMVAMDDLKEAILCGHIPGIKAALDTVQSLKLEDECVDEASRMMQDVRAFALDGALGGYEAGGRREGASWLCNPHYVLEVEHDSPVTFSVTMNEAVDSHMGVYALHAARNNVEFSQLAPDFSEVLGTEYNESISTITLKDAAPDMFPLYFVPSAFNKGVEGKFTLTFVPQTHGIKYKFTKVRKLEDRLVEAMQVADWNWKVDTEGNKNIGVLKELLTQTDSLHIENEVVDKSRRFLTKLQREETLAAAIKGVEQAREYQDEMEQPELVEVLSLALQECRGDGVADLDPDILGYGKQMLEQLQAEQSMRDTCVERDVPGLEYAIGRGQDADSNHKIVAKYTAKLRFFKAEDALNLALADLPEFDFDELSAAFSRAKAVGLSGEVMDEAERLLAMPGTIPLEFTEKFAAGGAYGLDSWLSNPQYQVQVTSSKVQKITVSMTTDHVKEKEEGSAEGAVASVEAEAAALAASEQPTDPHAFAIHVMAVSKPDWQQAAADGSGGTKLLMHTEYTCQAKTVTFTIKPDQTYFVVPSLHEPGAEHQYTLQFHQPCQRATGELLCKVVPVQMLQGILHDLKMLLVPRYGPASPEVLEACDRAEVVLNKAKTLGLYKTPKAEQVASRIAQLEAVALMEQANTDKDIERLQQNIELARQVKAPMEIVKQYRVALQRYIMDNELQEAIESMHGLGDDPLSESHARLQAAIDTSKIIQWNSPFVEEATAITEKFFVRSICDEFSTADGTAGGRWELGQFRDNPQFQVVLQGKQKQTVAISVVKGGDPPSRSALVDAEGAAEEGSSARDSARGSKRGRRDSSEGRVPGDLQDEDNEEEEEDLFEEFAVRVATNTSEWAPGGLGLGFSTLYESAYSANMKYIVLELDPSAGPFYIVPSTYDRHQEGTFTISIMSQPGTDISMSRIFPLRAKFEFEGKWDKGRGGPYSKNGENIKGKKFKVGGTWMQNPQFRVYLNHHIAGPNAAQRPTVTEANITVVLFTPIPDAMSGLHLMRNKQCQFYNEHVEVLASRYQILVDRTPVYAQTPEIQGNFVLQESHGVKGANDMGGSDTAFPFFVIPSLHDKSMGGNFYLSVYSDQDILVEMLNDSERKV
ncbi:hypothetical protein CYMTET_20568, partial [Cymbomonas tetramitiformis]